MTPKVWGPPVWIFFHTFSVNISEQGYANVGMQFFSYLIRICKQLPCPECADHATKFINKIKPSSLKTKYDMANMLCYFHNMVNARKRLPIFNSGNLSVYERVSIITAFSNFAKAFTLPTHRMMNENMQRKMLVSQINKFIATNLVYFIKPKPMVALETVKEPKPESNLPTKPVTELEPLGSNMIDYEVSYLTDETVSTNTDPHIDVIPDREGIA